MHMHLVNLLQNPLHVVKETWLDFRREEINMQELLDMARIVA
jgi:hypothetical protein